VTREQLEHAIRAACDVARDTELWIFGSQAILGVHPDAPASLRASIEVDVQPRNRPEAVDAIDGALGELSQFHQTYGFYVHGVPVETAVLPTGWESRVTAVHDDVTTAGCTGWCIELHDLAVSKLVAFREKDRDFVRTLLAERLITTGLLLERLAALPPAVGNAGRLRRWVQATAEDLAGE
jgi:hypothetical protein